MIGFLAGRVLFSDGIETIIQTPSGIGYQVFFNKVLREGSHVSVYISRGFLSSDSNSQLKFT